MAAKRHITAAHFMGDVAITDVAGASVAIPGSIRANALILTFEPVTGVAYYVLKLNDGVAPDQGTAYPQGSKKIRGGGILNLPTYPVKKITVTAHNTGGTALASGEFGYMAFMTPDGAYSYLVVT